MRIDLVACKQIIFTLVISVVYNLLRPLITFFTKPVMCKWDSFQNIASFLKTFATMHVYSARSDKNGVFNDWEKGVQDLLGEKECIMC